HAITNLLLCLTNFTIERSLTRTHKSRLISDIGPNGNRALKHIEQCSKDVALTDQGCGLKKAKALKHRRRSAEPQLRHRKSSAKMPKKLLHCLMRVHLAHRNVAKPQIELLPMLLPPMSRKGVPQRFRVQNFINVADSIANFEIVDELVNVVVEDEEVELHRPPARAYTLLRMPISRMGHGEAAKPHFLENLLDGPAVMQRATVGIVVEWVVAAPLQPIRR